ncbi:MAG: methyltransferase [Bacteroidetes bacterium]|nr:MAG: methyltransferase [Bacteroidota bacterium]
MEHTQTQAPPQAILFQLLGGQIISRAIGLAADLAIADHLAEGAQEITALAAATNTNADALYRVLRLLAGFGIFAELPGRRFGNSPLSEPLRTDAPGSVRHFARWFSDPMRWGALGKLDYSVHTGRPALLDGREDKTVFEVFGEYPASVETFNQAMTSISMGSGHAVVQAYDFRPYRLIVDVGGGHGFLATLIAQAAPDAHVTVFDWPQVAEGAAVAIKQAGLNGRVTTQGGNYLESIPGPADLIVMKNIVHGEPDDGALQLLRNCRAALNDDGRVLVIESVITEGPEGNGARVMDIEMLFGPGGRQRTVDEHRTLLEAAGLRFERLIPTSETHIIEAVVG